MGTAASADKSAVLCRALQYPPTMDHAQNVVCVILPTPESFPAWDSKHPAACYAGGIVTTSSSGIGK